MALKKKNLEPVMEEKEAVVLDESNIKKSTKTKNEDVIENYVALINVNKIYDNNVQAVFDFNLEIAQHEFVVFVGPSGCGKSTTLRMVAGIEEITSGELYIDGIYCNDVTPKDRDIAMVFQNYALYPNMTVFDNIAFSLRVRKHPKPLLDENGEQILAIDEAKVEQIQHQIDLMSGAEETPENFEILKSLHEQLAYYSSTPVPKFEMVHLTKEEINERVLKTAEILGITEYLNRKPKALSGGQRQRVALGRAIVRNAKVFLMDEPLSNLDAKLRVQMRSEIIKLHNRLKTTTIYVTHDQTEAMTMADRIVVMKDGYIQQVGTPIEIYRHPVNKFVASFIGSPAMNFVHAKMTDTGLLFKDGKTIELDEKTIKTYKDYYRNAEETLPGKIIELENKLLAINESRTANKKWYRRLTLIDVENDQELNKLKDALEFAKRVNSGLENEIIFGIRPEDIKEVTSGDSFTPDIKIVELLGDSYFVHFDFGEENVIAKILVEDLIDESSKINLRVDEKKIHLFDPILEEAIF